MMYEIPSLYQCLRYLEDDGTDWRARATATNRTDIPFAQKRNYQEL